MIDLELINRIVFITGASFHLGRTIARLFAAEGAWVAINFYADAHGAKDVLDMIRSEGGRALLAPGSVHDREGAWHVTQRVEMEWGQIDVLIHTASLLTDDERVPTPEHVIAELQPGMAARQWGRIVTFNTRDIALHLGAQVLANNIDLLEDNYEENCEEKLIDAAARLALFLGSGWNQCVTGQSFIVP